MVINTEFLRVIQRALLYSAPPSLTLMRKVCQLRNAILSYPYRIITISISLYINTVVSYYPYIIIIVPHPYIIIHNLIPKPNFIIT